MSNHLKRLFRKSDWGTRGGRGVEYRRLVSIAKYCIGGSAERILESVVFV